MCWPSRADPHTPLLVWLHGDHPTRSHKSPSETGQRVRPPPPPRQNPSFGGSFLTSRVTTYVVAPPTLPAETTLPNQQALPPPPKSPAREPPSSPRDGHQHFLVGPPPTLPTDTRLVTEDVLWSRHHCRRVDRRGCPRALAQSNRQGIRRRPASLSSSLSPTA